MAIRTSIAHFIGLHGGISALYDLAERLTSRRSRREKQSEIAAAYDMDAGSFSKMVDEFFTCIYILRPEVQEVIDELAKAKLERLAAAKRDQTRILRIATSRRRDLDDAEEGDAGA